VQPKLEEAYIPSMKNHRDLYAEDDGLRAFNALERFREMESRARGIDSGSLDLSRASALVARIGEYDPAVHGSLAEQPPADEEPEPAPVPAAARRAEADLTAVAASDPSSSDSVVVPAGETTGALARSAPVDEEGNVYGTSFRPSSTDMASLVEVAEPVEPGDVLVIDPERAGSMSLARQAGDTAVFGIVASEPGVVLGSDPIGEGGSIEPDGLLEPVSDPTGDGATVHGGAFRVPVAVSGMVLCKVDAGYGDIRPGDLLTTSPTPGHAMRADDPAAGTILGKALEPRETGTGVIRVLVMLR
jgi:hypothetical protein